MRYVCLAALLSFTPGVGLVIFTRAACCLCFFCPLSPLGYRMSA